ncbi:MFS transporter [Bacillus sp. M6-12]|uniref:MFS transporter n=1 Tax=Bacillus sp. M6-12 TaxID=2054166 RepID=UPI000C767323|nr:MFS transporter [Bacillus sp. M6-12]PLS17045.1 MFS transporter [Bacillus sp. M6-12]
MKCPAAHMSNPLWTKDFVFTTLANFFLFFGFHMLTPTLPVYVIEMNGTKLEAGLVVGIFTLSALITRPFAGRALDVLDKKHVLLFGLLVFTITVFSCGLAFSIALVLLLRILQGVGWGVATTAYATIVSDYITAERRAEGMGYFGLSINMGMALAPLMGIWVMTHWGFTSVFFIATASVVLSFFFSRYISLLEQPSKRVRVKEASIFEKSSLLPAFLIMLITFAHGGILSSLPLFGLEAGIRNVGWFFLAAAIFMMITRSIVGRITDRRGREFVLLPGVAALVLGLLMLSISRNTPLLMTAALFYGSGFGSIQPTLQAWTITRAKPERRGIATATYFSAFDLGVGIGALFVGLLTKWLDYSATYRISIILMIVFAAVYIISMLKEKKDASANPSNSNAVI